MPTYTHIDIGIWKSNQRMEICIIRNLTSFQKRKNKYGNNSLINSLKSHMHVIDTANMFVEAFARRLANKATAHTFE